MLKKVISFEDLDGAKVKDEFYFHMSIDDLTEWNKTREGGMEEYMTEMLKTSNVGALFDIFRELIALSYGEKSANNRAFLKSKEMRAEFTGSDAYDVLLLELMQDANAAVEFFNGVMPSKLQEQVKALGAGKLEQSETATPPKPKTVDDYTLTELTNMPFDEFNALMDRADVHKVGPGILKLAFQRRSSNK
jgi:hypothetical protein